MLNKIVLAGGGGYLGQVLANYFRHKTEEIIVLSRKAAAPGPGNVLTVVWDGESMGHWVDSLEGADMVINLCGKNVNCRYTTKAKKEILNSRLLPTALLGKAISSLASPPKVWINAASATIYRHAENRPQTEAAGEVGTGFSVEVCQAWENCFWQAKTPHTRKLALRIGLVLGRSDGVFPRLKNLVLAGLGGHQGSGRQYISWIHQQDFARAVDWLSGQGKEGEAYNITAPEAVHNKQFMALMRQTAGIPVGLPTPQWLLDIGALIIGTEPELVLKSRWVYPQMLLDGGFRFQFPDLAPAIREIFSTCT